MTEDDASDENQHDGDEGQGKPTRIEVETNRAIEQFDQGIIDLLSWLLDTETRARIYIYLRKYPDETSEEIAKGTGLYPSTVRESLAELHADGIVTREKRKNDGAGNNPYEYQAISPSALVTELANQVQSQLNTVFNLDRYLNNDPTDVGEPIRIEVRNETEDTDDTDDTDD